MVSRVGIVTLCLGSGYPIGDIGGLDGQSMTRLNSLFRLKYHQYLSYLLRLMTSTNQVSPQELLMNLDWAIEQQDLSIAEGVSTHSTHRAQHDIQQYIKIATQDHLGLATEKHHIFYLKA